jgi:hypothetical protein
MAGSSGQDVAVKLPLRNQQLRNSRISALPEFPAEISGGTIEPARRFGFRLALCAPMVSPLLARSIHSAALFCGRAFSGDPYRQPRNENARPEAGRLDADDEGNVTEDAY